MKRNLWPYAIIAYFAIFITAMASWITFAVRNDTDLVRTDYYEHEIRYQEQIEKQARTRAIPVSYEPGSSTLTIALTRGQVATGEIHLFRPSDAKLDQRIPFTTGPDGLQTVKLASLAGGLWKARISWTAEKLDYYFEKPLVVPAGR